MDQDYWKKVELRKPSIMAKKEAEKMEQENKIIKKGRRPKLKGYISDMEGNPIGRIALWDNE